MSKRKYDIIPVKYEAPVILEGTYRKPMSKKRWKQPNETLWTFVLGAGFFLMSGGANLAILLISIVIQGVSLYKLGGIVDLEEVS